MAEVFINGFRNAHHRAALCAQPVGHAQGVFSAQGDHGIQAKPGDIGQDFIRAVVRAGLARQSHAKRVGARRTQIGAAIAVPAPDLVILQPDGLVYPRVEQTVPAIGQAHHLYVMGGGTVHNRLERRVQARGVTPSGQHADSSDSHRHLVVVFIGQGWRGARNGPGDEKTRGEEL